MCLLSTDLVVTRYMPGVYWECTELSYVLLLNFVILPKSFVNICMLLNSICSFLFSLALNLRLYVSTRIQMVPMVSCQGRILNQNFNIPSGQALAVLQPTALTLMTSSRLELQKLTVTPRLLPMTPFRSMAMRAEDHWLDL